MLVYAVSPQPTSVKMSCKPNGKASWTRRVTDVLAEAANKFPDDEVTQAKHQSGSTDDGDNLGHEWWGDALPLDLLWVKGIRRGLVRPD